MSQIRDLRESFPLKKIIEDCEVDKWEQFVNMKISCAPGHVCGLADSHYLDAVLRPETKEGHIDIPREWEDLVRGSRTHPPGSGHISFIRAQARA